MSRNQSTAAFIAGYVIMEILIFLVIASVVLMPEELVKLFNNPVVSYASN